MDDFRLYPSNALDVLAGLLAAELRKPAEGAALLAPDTILIPQVAMKRWLQATLAAEYGIAANLEFITPGEFVARALEANLGKASSDLDMAFHDRLGTGFVFTAATGIAPVVRLLLHKVTGRREFEPVASAGGKRTPFRLFGRKSK